MGRTVTQFYLNSSTFFDMKFLALSVILALAVALSSAASVDQAFASQWQNFKSLHGKSYDATEEKLRMQIFSANMDRISRHNARYMKGEVTYSMGMNQFGDLTTEEFSKLHKLPNSSMPAHLFSRHQPITSPTPASTGEITATSAVLRIRDLVEAAGRSQPLVFWKECWPKKPAEWSP